MASTGPHILKQVYDHVTNTLALRGRCTGCKQLQEVVETPSGLVMVYRTEAMQEMHRPAAISGQSLGHR